MYYNIVIRIVYQIYFHISFKYVIFDFIPLLLSVEPKMFSLKFPISIKRFSVVFLVFQIIFVYFQSCIQSIQFLTIITTNRQYFIENAIERVFVFLNIFSRSIFFVIFFVEIALKMHSFKIKRFRRRRVFVDFVFAFFCRGCSIK